MEEYIFSYWVNFELLLPGDSPDNLDVCVMPAIVVDFTWFNPYAAGGLFCQYKMMQKKPEKWLKPSLMGTHLRVLSKSFSMSTNMAGFRWFLKIFASLCFGWT